MVHWAAVPMAVSPGRSEIIILRLFDTKTQLHAEVMERNMSKRKFCRVALVAAIVSAVS